MKISDTGKKSASKQTITMFLEHNSERTRQLLEHFNEDWSKIAKSLMVSRDDKILLPNLSNEAMNFKLHVSKLGRKKPPVS